MAGRQARHSRDELRALLIATGKAVLREEGLGTGAESLTFKKVFDRVQQDAGVRLTNASVIRRLWLNQAEFQADVLAAIAVEENEGEIDLTVDAVVPILDGADLSTPKRREQVMRELCRVGGAANMQAVRESDNWPFWITVWNVATVGEQLDEYRKKIEMALLAGYESFAERIEAVYRGMTGLLGFRLREPLTIRQFSTAADSLGQGFGLRSRIDRSTTDPIFRSTGPDGGLQEWTTFAIAFEALVFHFFEIDPNWAPDGGGS
jgi:hypothetical protein